MMRRNILHRYLTLSYDISNVVISSINMFGSTMEFGILCECNTQLQRKCSVITRCSVNYKENTLEFHNPIYSNACCFIAEIIVLLFFCRDNFVSVFFFSSLITSTYFIFK